MVKVIGVRFRTAGKIYFFDPLGFEIKRGDHVIVETARGIEFGTVVTGITEVAEEKVVSPLKPVIRIANRRDMEQEAANRDKEKEAFRICLEKIRSHGLEMKLIDAEYTFDNNKVLFYFTADGRIDFRELVKDLAGVFKTRIELRQIGVRDETKIVGGIGICGRSLCCHSYLSDFVPVSIKMAKEQNLSLNPAKISGVCGRLMCCLKNEEETYEELNRRLPNIGDYVTIEGGLRGEVHSVNVLRQLVKVVVDAGDEKEIKEFPVEKLHFRRKHSKKEKMELSREELEELERLEDEERQKKEQADARAEEQRQEGRNRHRQGGGQKASGQNAEEGGRQNRDGSHRPQGQAGEEPRRQGQDGSHRPQNAEDAGRQNRDGSWRPQNQNAEDAGRQNRDGSWRPQNQNAEDAGRQNRDGSHRPQNQNAEDAGRQNRDGSRRQQGQNGEGGRSQNPGSEGMSDPGRGTGGDPGRRPRGNGNSRQNSQRTDRNRGFAEQGEEDYRFAGHRQGGKNRRDNRKRQDYRGQQENAEYQGGRNRYNNRNRHDAKAAQERNVRADGSQNQGE